MVTACNRYTGNVEYVSPIVPRAEADDLASVLRRFTKLSVAVARVAPTGAVQLGTIPDAN